MGSILKPLEQGFDGFQYVRRGRRLSKHRVSHFLVLLAVIFLFCLAALGVNMFLHGKMEDNISSNRIIRDVIVEFDDEGRHESSISSDRIGTSLGVHTVDLPPKRTRRRKCKEISHISCLTKLSVSEVVNGNRSHGRTDFTFEAAPFLKGNGSAVEFLYCCISCQNCRDLINSIDGTALQAHSPCNVSLSKSVDYLVEPTTFTNFTRFSLQYIEKEDDYSSDLRFAGHQKLDEREKSFIAGNQTLHCGFVKGPEGSLSTGFDLEEKDIEFMRTCKIVVSSCIFGSSDFLRRPTTKQISEYSKQNVCFVMFVDEQTLSTLSSEGHVPDDRGNVGLWRIVVVSNLPYKDMRRTGKVPKFLSHRLFPSSRYSIWVDSKMRLNTDPMLIIEHFLWRTESEYAISNHYERHCVWEEVLQNKRLNKYSHAAIDEQFLFYQSDGLIKFNATDSETPLPSYVPEGSFIVRAHTPMSNLFSCVWFNEVDRFTSRDQLSFAYTYLKLRRMNPDKPFHLNMFKDCERRSLVKLFHHRELTQQRGAGTT